MDFWKSGKCCIARPDPVPSQDLTPCLPYIFPMTLTIPQRVAEKKVFYQTTKKETSC